MKQLIKFTNKVILSNLRELSLPYKLTLSVTSRCNHKCKICNVWAKTGQRQEFSLDEVELFFKKSGFFSWISLTGGEIFLRKDIVQICEIISKHVNDICFLTFPTNGFLTDNILKAAEKIADLNFSKVVVSISLDGPPGLHDDLRGTPGAWDKAVKTFLGIKAIKHKKLSVNFGYTISNYNLLSLKDTLENVRAIYPQITMNDFHLNLAFNASFYNNLDNPGILIKNREAFIEQINQYQAKKTISDPISFIDILHCKLLKKFINFKKIPLPCQSLCSSCFIDEQWDLYPCINFGEKICNLKDLGFDIRQAWREPNLKKIRKIVKDGQCPQCWTPCESFQTILGNLPRAILS